MLHRLISFLAVVSSSTLIRTWLYVTTVTSNLQTADHCEITFPDTKVAIQKKTWELFSKDLSVLLRCSIDRFDGDKIKMDPMGRRRAFVRTE
jgi:hypothetical protein